MSGTSIFSAGDLNADGIADFLIGARQAAPAAGRESAGKTYVVFGQSGLGAGGVLELASLNGINGFVLNGQNNGDESGNAVSYADDVNADGIADVVVGAWKADPSPRRGEAGRAYVVFGRKPAVSTEGTDITTAQKPSPSSMEVTTLWSRTVATTDVIQTAAFSTGPDGTVIALAATIVGLVLSMCGGAAGLFLRHKLKASDKGKSVPLREPVYQEAQEQLTPVYATIPTVNAQRESNYSDWPHQEEPVYEELELREGSHYVTNIADIMPDHESASESTS